MEIEATVSRRVRLVALAKATFAVAVWGASFIATKLALREASPVVVIWLRFGIGVIILGGFVVRRKELAIAAGRELGYFSLLGFLGITFHQWLQATGLVTARATTTAWIITTIPIFIAILGRLVLNERLGWDRIGGIALATIGVLLVVTRGDLESILQGQIGSTGDLLVLISAPNWAIFSVLSRRALKNHPATQMMFYVMLFGWIFTTAWLAASGKYDEVLHISAGGWVSILFLGVLCSGFAYIFWYDALKELTASQVGSLLYIEPLVAVAVAALLLSEPLFLAAILGGALILAGVWLVNRLRTVEGPPEQACSATHL
jgi:drug/metabolite transporter (DMT)-like permease